MLKRILNMLGMKKVIDSKTNAMHNECIRQTPNGGRMLKAFYFEVIENQGMLIVLAKSLDSAIKRLERDGIELEEVKFQGSRDFKKAA